MKASLALLAAVLLLPGCATDRGASVLVIVELLDKPTDRSEVVREITVYDDGVVEARSVGDDRVERTRVSDIALLKRSVRDDETECRVSERRNGIPVYREQLENHHSRWSRTVEILDLLMR